jgi:hypothetical protein
MKKPSEHRNGDDAGKVGSSLERLRGGQALSDPLVRPCDVEIVEAVLLQYALKVPLPEDDDVIETVAPEAAEKSLANRIPEHQGSFLHDNPRRSRSTPL